MNPDISNSKTTFYPSDYVSISPFANIYAFSNAIYRIAKNQPHHSQRIYFIFSKYHFLYKNYGINKVNISTNLADIEETFIQLEFPIKYLKGILKDYQ